MGMTSEGVVQAFRDYLAERAHRGVVLARSVADVTFDDGVVSVFFDPAAAGFEVEAVLATNPFANLAQFPGTVLSFGNELGSNLRAVVDRVETYLADGTDLGSLTVAELYEMGTGRKL